MKPEKYTWVEVMRILLDPPKTLLANFVNAIKVNVLGYWYCSHCGDYHSLKIKSYGFFIRTCSLGLDEKKEVE